MDDPFGCLQGEKISSKIIQEMLQKRNEISLLSKKINRCPSCEEQIVYVVNELCLACQKCGRVIECDDYEYFEEENWRRSSTALPTNNDYLKSVLRKWNIKEMFSSSEVDFLGNVIAQFQKMSGKSVNYSMLPSFRTGPVFVQKELYLIIFVGHLNLRQTKNSKRKRNILAINCRFCQAF